jgi:hypothetical protein
VRPIELVPTRLLDEELADEELLLAGLEDEEWDDATAADWGDEGEWEDEDVAWEDDEEPDGEEK